jgi:hypothetical protein
MVSGGASLEIPLKGMDDGVAMAEDKTKKVRTSPEPTFDGASQLMEQLLRGDARSRVIGGIVAKSRNLADALQRLRVAFRSHTFHAGPVQFALESTVRRLDIRTQQDGFHVLRDWDGKADRLLDELIAVDVLDYMGRSLPPDFLKARVDERGTTVLAILFDYYLLYVLALFCLRCWDEGDPNDNLDRVTQMIRDLQGPDGSGQQFVENAETLILIATSHFEPDDKAYERLVLKQRSLDETHRLNIALVHAAVLSSHLRHGFQDLYKRDIVLLRNDNVPDYPCLCFALATLMSAYARMRETGEQGLMREKVVEGILNGLTPDARAFVGKPPSSLTEYETERAQFSEGFLKYQQDLFEEFERHRPSGQPYTPMGFSFNFPHNLMKGIVVDALFEAEPSRLTLNELLSGIPRDQYLGEMRVAFAEKLMGYAKISPDTIRGRVTPTINYDPYLGLRNMTKTINIIKEQISDKTTLSN